MMVVVEHIQILGLGLNIHQGRASRSGWHSLESAVISIRQRLDAPTQDAAGMCTLRHSSVIHPKGNPDVEPL